MARIRSIHPSLFTDEAFMGLSPYAMAALAGLWCEADDQGVFEWKPMTLKARILPCAAVNMAELLEEYERAGIVRRFTDGEKDYAAIKNFRKFQRPEKPKAVHPLPDDLRSFVAIDEKDAKGRQPVIDQSPTSPRKISQMEDGVGDGKGKKEEESACAGAPAILIPAEAVIEKEPPGYPAAFELLWDSFPKTKNSSKFKAYRAWRDLSAKNKDLCLDGVGPFIDELEVKRRSWPEFQACHLLTYINQRRWEALLEPAQ